MDIIIKSILNITMIKLHNSQFPFVLLLVVILANIIIPLPFAMAIKPVAASAATCALNVNCDLHDSLLTTGGAGGTAVAEKGNGDKIEKEIASLFEDKVNYSLKLFGDGGDPVLEYAGKLERNVTATKTTTTTTTTKTSSTQLMGNFTLNDNDIEENERDYVHNIARRFLALSTPFNAARNPDSSTQCRSQMRRYLTALENFDLWALKMHDATGKINSGVLNGNINQPGDFDQCLNIRTHNNNNNNNNDDDSDGDGDNDDMIRGQYCLAYAQPVLPYKSKRLQTFFKLLQSHGPFRSEFNDPGHRVPRYSLVNWGICVPAACNYRDVEYSVKEFLNNMTTGTGISFQVRVEPRMCQVRKDAPWDRNTTWAVRFFVLIVSIALLSTVYECCVKKHQKPNPWLTAFSLDRNSRWLFSTRSSPDDIEAVHGIRFLNALMLLFSHKSMAMFFNAYNNRTEMSESLGRSWTVIGRAASLYTDPFLLFSGMLTAYSLFGRLNKGQPVRLKNEYINRLMRIVPPLAALILFCTFVLPMWGSGPQWNLVVGHHADICKQHWWRNLLFIHNYFGFSEMCLTHTHHLGIDTELFAVAPLLIFALWKWPRKGLYALILLCGIGTAARYHTTIVNQLSNYIYFGTNIQRLFRTADYMYSFPPYRSTVYIMGILLGYALRSYRGIHLSRSQLRVGWALSTVCVLASLLGPAPMGDINYQYNPTHAAVYAAFAPIAWCVFFAWIVFVSHNGYKNAITKALSWKGFQVSTKLSYALYLTQFPVFFYNVGRRRHIHHYYNFVSTILDTNEYISIFFASVALTLLFDAPFQNLKKLIFNNRSKSSPQKEQPKATTAELCDSDANSINNNNNNNNTKTSITSTLPSAEALTTNRLAVHNHLHTD